MLAKDQALGLWNLAGISPNLTVVVSPHKDTTYAELTNLTNKIANGFVNLGLKKADKIALVCKNNIEFLSVVLAGLQSGIYIIPINHHATDKNIGYILKDSGAKLLVVDPEFINQCEAGIAHNNLEVIRCCTAKHEGYLEFYDFFNQFDEIRPQRTLGGQILQYTSGTTGNPKGVLRPIKRRSADDLAIEQTKILEVFKIDVGHWVHLVTSPLYHTAVMNIAISALHIGQKVVLMEKWDEVKCLELIQSHKVTSSHMVAAQFYRLLSLSKKIRRGYDCSSLSNIIHGAAPTPINIKKEMIAWWGEVIYEYYGSTEVGATIIDSKTWQKKVGSVGVPMPGSSLKILDKSKKEVSVGTQGLVYMKMSGQSFEYFNDKKKTDKSTHLDFICVGDIGFVDNDGFLFLCGRDAEVIISGGVNIYPNEIEARILEHPSILDVGVIGVPDIEYGEQVKAVAMRNNLHHEVSDAQLELEIINFCKKGLSHILCPKSVDFVTNLPRDPSGKLYKQELKKKYENKEDLLTMNSTISDL
jgi:long-chain acyl-CoA synthetase